MRKLHKKYIILNVFLIIYILSLSVGYAYFSESIKATGTAKTLSYYTQPFKPIDAMGDTELGGENYFSSGVTYKYTTISAPYYYMYYDVNSASYGTWVSFYIYLANYAKDVNITDLNATFYDNSSITVDDPDWDDYIEYYPDGGGTDANDTEYYTLGYINFNKKFTASSFTTAGTTKQVYIRVSYKSQGTTRYMYFYYYFNVK